MASAATAFGISVDLSQAQVGFGTRGIIGHVYTFNNPGTQTFTGNSRQNAIDKALFGVQLANIEDLVEFYNSYTKKLISYSQLNPPEEVVFRKDQGVVPGPGGSVSIVDNGNGTWTVTITGPTRVEVIDHRVVPIDYVEHK